MEHADVVVIGGGQSGLATAHALQCRGLRLVVLEASGRTAGSGHSDGRERGDRRLPVRAGPGQSRTRSAPRSESGHFHGWRPWPARNGGRADLYPNRGQRSWAGCRRVRPERPLLRPSALREGVSRQGLAASGDAFWR
ncbi:FAD-dependent oxidoreductase [Streptomyces sp. NPDC002577]